MRRARCWTGLERFGRLAPGAVLSVFLLVACSGGGGGGDSAGNTGGSSGGGSSGSGGSSAPAPDAFATEAEAARFLTQATFGPTAEDIDTLTQASVSDWLKSQIDATPSVHLPGVLNWTEQNIPDNRNWILAQTPSASWWREAVMADDQLRQRVAYALSQILVVSAPVDSELFYLPTSMAAYMDVLTQNAFGNYRDLLEEVTYSPAMAIFLTYMKNQKADMSSGRVPDENYARELMQLFTIGLYELELDGSRKTQNGQPVETYDNEDIRNLARVFTGLSYDADRFHTYSGNLTEAELARPLKAFADYHSPEEKAFLSTVILANTGPEESISLALDEIFNHPNVAPFVGRQLIQRLVTSHPSPAYVRRVSTAFEAGSYTLPDGSQVGDGRRGDLGATVCAILMDDEARLESRAAASTFGKVREPVLRVTHWARAFHVNSADTMDEVYLFDASSPERLAQHPYRAPSVFNFYRPGYIAPGFATGDAQLNAPELQLVNETTVVGFTNLLSAYLRDDAPKQSGGSDGAFSPDYSLELSLAEEPDALLDHLDIILMSGGLEADTRERILAVMSEIPVRTDTNENAQADRLTRVHLAIMMMMTAPEYTIQR